MIVFPKTIVVGPFVYKIEEKDIVLNDDNSGLLWGHCSTQVQIVTIKTGCPDDRRLTIFFHEFLHAIDDAYGDIGLSEEQVTTLGLAFAALFKHNDLAFLLK